MFRQYTKCYQHTPGDKPFNESDLVLFVLGNSAPGVIAAILSFLNGSNVIGFLVIALQYAATIRAIAKEWLYHRLVCVSGDQCAIGKVDWTPEIETLLGAFDNDQFFDIRLMPHRYNDLYGGPNTGFFAAPASSSDPYGTAPWAMNSPPAAGPSLDGLTEMHPANDVYLDGFQGAALICPKITDLPYTPVDWDKEEALLFAPPSGDQKVNRATLHCEAEGSFWQVMLDTSFTQGVLTGVGAAAGAAAGGAAGCEALSFLGPLGCLLGAIFGGLAGAAAAAAAGATAAFNAQQGDVNDANVGDIPLGPLNTGDPVVVFGTHVYDGFHEGWHEIHPLKAIVRYPTLPVPFGQTAAVGMPYLEWDPNATLGYAAYGLSVTDVQQGLGSAAFRAVAVKIKNAWCALLSERFDAAVIAAQGHMENRWTIHPSVDGCQPGPAPVTQ
jgi:hypothetical protein